MGHGWQLGRPAGGNRRRSIYVSRLECYVAYPAPVLLLFHLSIVTRPGDSTGKERSGRHAPLPVPLMGESWFHHCSIRRGLAFFTNRVAVDRCVTNQIYLNGSGVAAGDIDGDGWCDLYFCGLDGANALYRNLSDWQFQDITETAGVACSELDATGAALADIDGDGDLDLIVNSIGGGTHVFLNDGQGHFTKSAVLNVKRGGASLALADMDGDGDLDLYLANYRTETIRSQLTVRYTVRMEENKPVVVAVDGRPLSGEENVGRYILEADGRVVEQGEVDAFYRNNGLGVFSLISFLDGTFLDEVGKPLASPPRDWGLSVMLRDLNGDGSPDIYVCNDFRSEDRIWINNGSGRFRAIPRLAVRCTSMFSMGVDVADLNRDGFDEILVADMLNRTHLARHLHMTDMMPLGDRPQYSRNTLFLNRGDGTYAEIGQFSGLHASDWSWMPVFLDVDLDGYEDVLVPTGIELYSLQADVSNQIEAIRVREKLSRAAQLRLAHRFPRWASPNLAFRNRGDLTFEEVSALWGFNAPTVSQGMALADLDNDGDLDAVVNNMNGPAGLCRNDTTAPRLAVRLRGLAPNTRGIGAKIKVLGGPVMQTQEVISGGRYLSSDDAMRVFAAGTATNQLQIEVTGRNGKQSVVRSKGQLHL